jgi:D-aminopeptidase
LKIFIVTDLEGPAGVNRWVQTREGETLEKTAAMRLLTGEVNAAVDGILDAAPHAEMVIWDGHGDGGLVFEAIHPKASVVMRGAGNSALQCLDSSFDALYFVGQHFECASLPHLFVQNNRVLQTEWMSGWRNCLRGCDGRIDGRSNSLRCRGR